MTTKNKNTVIVIESRSNTNHKCFMRCYKNDYTNKWAWKSVDNIQEATKFDEKTAAWRSQKHQINDSYGMVNYKTILVG